MLLAKGNIPTWVTYTYSNAHKPEGMGPRSGGHDGRARGWGAAGGRGFLVTFIAVCC